MGSRLFTDLSLPLRIREILRDSVRKRWASLVFMSGGLDSGLLGFLTNQIKPVHAMTFGFRSRSPALASAGVLAGSLRISWEAVVCSPKEFAQAVPEAIQSLRSFLVPHVRMGTLFLLLMRRAMSSGWGAAVVGEGADELFSARRDVAQKILKPGLYLESVRVSRPLGFAVRHPFLDFRLVRLLLREGSFGLGKLYLRRAFAGLFPRRFLLQKIFPS